MRRFVSNGRDEFGDDFDGDLKPVLNMASQTWPCAISRRTSSIISPYTENEL